MKPEDLDRMVDHCKKLVAANQSAYVDPDTLWMARFILDTLGTSFPCGFAEPRVVNTPDGDVVMIDDIEFGRRDEAIGVAVGLIRTALELPEEEAEHHCGQCGWSGRGFHACPGLPGENQF